MAMNETMSLEDALMAVEELLGYLQDLYYRLEHTDDLDSYGVQESILESLRSVLDRYDAME